MSTSPIHDWLDAHLSETLRDLCTFLEIESISTQPQHQKDVALAAEWLCEACRTIGMSAQVHPTEGNPIVVAEWRGAPEGAPTVLVYAHYDVQPVDPLREWISPPFEPTLRDDRLYARGAADDKGQLWIHIFTIRAYLACRHALPVNIVLLVEGEEESGSKHLLPFVRANRERFMADYIVISDTPMFAEGVPSVLASLRGIAYFEITCQGPSSDLHSGQYGGAVRNPATTLARIIASLHDSDGRIAIAGFYDSVPAMSIHERERIKALPFDEPQFIADIGVSALAGEEGFSTLERLWKRPTCEVNGILGGYVGDGAKTVLPASAMAKVSFRLVSGQTPQNVEGLLRAHLERLSSPGVKTTLRMLHGGMPWSGDAVDPAFGAAKRALGRAFGRPAVIGGSGGSIPIVGDLVEILNAPALLIGFGLPTENAHSPNEWLSVSNFRLGSHAISELYEELASKPSSPSHDSLPSPSDAG
jgi:acetylornithine deacetylase/succinyl-diaminopimelate desuccinylase-like protein